MNRNLNNLKVGKTIAGAVISLARSGSKGLRGTRENMACHAEACKQFVEELVVHVHTIPFKQWTQGHNVHTLVTTDGRQYRFRPLFVEDKGYVGLELLQVVPGGAKVVIMQIKDHRSLRTCKVLLAELARPQVDNKHHSGAETERMVRH